jgi:hypothetical protein
MNIWVKVVGFTDVERHSLNTLFRLSVRRSPCYCLWTPEQASPPHVALIDVDSYEAGLELASPMRNPHLKVICVGNDPPDLAWCTFTRPVDWHALVRALDGLFASLADVDVDLNLGDPLDKVVPPGVHVALLVGFPPEQGFYLRARLALAGMTDVDDAPTAQSASGFLSRRHYDAVIVSTALEDADPWALVRSLKGLVAPPRSVIVAARTPSWATIEQAEQLGCLGLLEIPFNPLQVASLLNRA